MDGWWRCVTHLKILEPFTTLTSHPRNIDVSSHSFPLNSWSGSVTLHQWQQLAKPNLGGILHPRPGVLTKDFRELEVDIQHVYSLNDLEEDDPDLSHLSEVHGLGRSSITPKCHSSPSLLISPSCSLPAYMLSKIPVSCFISLYQLVLCVSSTFHLASWWV